MAVENNNFIADSLWNRGNLNALKLALLYACSMYDGRTLSDDPKSQLRIEKYMVEWAIEFSTFLVESLIYRASNIDHDEGDKVGEATKKIVEYLKSIKGGFCKKTELYKKAKIRSKFIMDQALDSLRDMEAISVHNQKPEGSRKLITIVKLL